MGQRTELCCSPSTPLPLLLLLLLLFLVLLLLLGALTLAPFGLLRPWALPLLLLLLLLMALPPSQQLGVGCAPSCSSVGPSRYISGPAVGQSSRPRALFLPTFEAGCCGCARCTYSLGFKMLRLKGNAFSTSRPLHIAPLR